MSDKPKYGKVIEGAEQLSLGISIVVSVLLGVGIGMMLENFFDSRWLFWLGVFWGFGGAVLNVYKAYKKIVKSFDELKADVRYKKYKQPKNKDDDDDDNK